MKDNKLLDLDDLDNEKMESEGMPEEPSNESDQEEVSKATESTQNEDCGNLPPEENDTNAPENISTNGKDKKKKIWLFILAAVFLGIVGFMLLPKGGQDEKTKEPVDYMQYVTGINDLTLLKNSAGKDIDLMKDITWDQEYIDKVTCDSSKLDITKAGTYEVTYTIDVKEDGVEDITKKIKVTVTEDKQAVEKAEAAKKEEEAKKENESASNAAANNNSSTTTDRPTSNQTQTSSKPSTNTGNIQSQLPTNTGTPSAPTHTHNWVAVTKIVEHPEQGHPEDVLISEAWDEPVYEHVAKSICNQCGADITNNYIAHFKQNPNCGGYHTEWILQQVDTIHHDAVYEQQYIVDEDAWTETVTTGYECACGATK